MTHKEICVPIFIARQGEPPAKDPPNSQAYIQTYVQAYIQIKADTYTTTPSQQHPTKQNSKKILPYIIATIV